jgi:hypothetical protein
VVIDNLDFVSLIISPCKADSPAVIDPNAVLSRSIPCQLFQAIGRGTLQISRACALLSLRSFRKATGWMSGGSLRECWRVKICWVSRSLNDLITSTSYNAERYTSNAIKRVAADALVGRMEEDRR